MIDKLKSLLNKTSELENQIEEIEKSNQSKAPQVICSCFSKNLLNFSILSSRTILLAEFNVDEDSVITFQNQIDINLATNQKVKFSIIVNDISIYKSTKNLNAGYNQVNLIKTYTPFISEKIKVYLQITSVDNKLVTLISESLFVWGINESYASIEYQAVETSDKFLLSYINNNVLYFLYTNKENTANNYEDFNYFSSAKSHSFVYVKNQNKIYLFRVDLDGRLFYSNFDDNNEIYLTNNVSKVSAAASSDTICVTYVKDNICHYLEINKDGKYSIDKTINNLRNKIINTYVYYNNYKSKFYIVLTDEYSSNFIMESLSESKSSSSTLNASYEINITTYGG